MAIGSKVPGKHSPRPLTIVGWSSKHFIPKKAPVSLVSFPPMGQPFVSPKKVTTPTVGLFDLSIRDTRSQTSAVKWPFAQRCSQRPCEAEFKT